MNTERIERARLPENRMGPNTKQVEAFIDWVNTAPRDRLDAFTATSHLNDSLWPEALANARTDAARQGELLALPLYWDEAEREIRSALLGRLINAENPCHLPITEAATDLVYRPFVDRIIFGARWARYPLAVPGVPLALCPSCGRSVKPTRGRCPVCLHDIPSA